MIIAALLDKKPAFSFELFLPRPPEALDPLFDLVRELAPLMPSYITLTYRAGDGAQDKNAAAAARIQKDFGIPTVSHMTGFLHTRREISKFLDRLAERGVSHVLALRGDLPEGARASSAGDREFPNAVDLVRFIRTRGGFRIGVAGYPETHPEAASPDDDMRHLAAKVRCGGEWVTTQLFFDNASYFGFVERARKAGVHVPVVPGIMPVTNYSQLKRFSALCGVRLPAPMREQVEELKDSPEALAAFGVDYATRQCRELLAGGAPGIHFYTLNRTRATAEILSRLRSLQAPIEPPRRIY